MILTVAVTVFRAACQDDSWNGCNFRCIKRRATGGGELQGSRKENYKSEGRSGLGGRCDVALLRRNLATEELSDSLLRIKYILNIGDSDVRTVSHGY